MISCYNCIDSIRKKDIPMKLKSGFVLSSVYGKNLVIPTGSRGADFNGMITMNETGAFLWKQLESDKSEEELVSAVCGHYPEVKEDYAAECVRDFVKQLREADVLE